MNLGNVGFAVALPSASRASAADGAAIDLASTVEGQHTGFLGAGPGGRSFTAIMSVGAVGTTMDVNFQYSADGTTGWTDIPGGAFTTVEDAVTEERIDFVSPERYVRCRSHTQTGTYVFGVILLGQQRYS